LRNDLNTLCSCRILLTHKRFWIWEWIWGSTEVRNVWENLLINNQIQGEIMTWLKDEQGTWYIVYCVGYVIHMYTV
jgi:hypothetical protein